MRKKENKLFFEEYLKCAKMKNSGLVGWKDRHTKKYKKKEFYNIDQCLSPNWLNVRLF